VALGLMGCGGGGQKRSPVVSKFPAANQTECSPPVLILGGEIDGQPVEERLCADGGGGFSNGGGDAMLPLGRYYAVEHKSALAEVIQWSLEFSQHIEVKTKKFAGRFRYKNPEGRIIGHCPGEKFPMMVEMNAMVTLTFEAKDLVEISSS